MVGPSSSNLCSQPCPGFCILEVNPVCISRGSAAAHKCWVSRWENVGLQLKLLIPTAVLDELSGEVEPAGEMLISQRRIFHTFKMRVNMVNSQLSHSPDNILLNRQNGFTIRVG